MIFDALYRGYACGNLEADKPGVIAVTAAGTGIGRAGEDIVVTGSSNAFCLRTAAGGAGKGLHAIGRTGSCCSDYTTVPAMARSGNGLSLGITANRTSLGLFAGCGTGGCGGGDPSTVAVTQSRDDLMTADIAFAVIAVHAGSIAAFGTGGCHSCRIGRVGMLALNGIACVVGGTLLTQNIKSQGLVGDVAAIRCVTTPVRIGGIDAHIPARSIMIQVAGGRIDLEGIVRSRTHTHTVIGTGTIQPNRCVSFRIEDIGIGRAAHIPLQILSRLSRQNCAVRGNCNGYTGGSCGCAIIIVHSIHRARRCGYSDDRGLVGTNIGQIGQHIFRRTGAAHRICVQRIQGGAGGGGEGCCVVVGLFGGIFTELGGCPA